MASLSQDSMTSHIVCFICKKSLEEGFAATVKKKGIKTLLKSSIKRGRKNHTRFLKKRDIIQVHRACSKNYCDERRINVFLRQVSHQVNQVGPVIASPQQFRIDCGNFDFIGQCFLCGESIESDYEKKQKKLPVALRNAVHLVEKKDQRDKFLEAAKIRGDEWAEKVIYRIAPYSDLVLVNAKYHHDCQKKLYQAPNLTMFPKGYRPCTKADEAMNCVYSFLEENKEECQFSFSQLMNAIKEGCQVDRRTVKSRLLNKYGEDILFVETCNKSTVCFKNTGYKILTENWYANKQSNPEEERLRVVKAAADIITEDIRSHVYNITEYPPPDQFLNTVESDIPKSLLTLLETVILKNKKGPLEKWKRTIVAISHAIIAATRPRSFVSPLLTGLSVFMYRKFGSKLLIDMMSSLGFSSSHHEAQLLEASSIAQSQPPLKIPNADAFCQLVFDNADFNVNTIDGHGTFHAMGGIACVTPFEAAGKMGKVKRLGKMSTSEILATTGGSVHIQRFVKKPDTGLRRLEIKDLNMHPSTTTDVISQTAANILWLLGKSNDKYFSGWNGFMENITANREFQLSKIFYLPFINAIPTNHDTIYTSLLIARQKCDSVEQKTCFVTFDQPLYMKAQEILHNGTHTQLQNVIARLGGFHLLMSFMGAIGAIMAGSGITDLFATIYAENSIIKIMSGHAYSRAVRAHMLTHLALGTLILNSIAFTSKERNVADRLISQTETSMILDSDDVEEITVFMELFTKAIQDLRQRGPTAQLWVQYYEMVTLLKQFIEAEKMGNFQLHLNTIQKMIPFFHAAGHWPYAKSAHLYLQEMLGLKERMDSSEFEKFTVRGYFTIRKTNKFWSGVWTDMTIEQKLMKDMKIGGGLTSGRGITDSTLTKWTLGMTYLQDITQQMENFTDVTALSSEQHVEMRPARIMRDCTDEKKLQQWLSQHSPFPEVNVIMSISSGIVGSDQVNCHKAQQVGMVGVSRIVGTTFGDVSFKKKNKVITLAFDKNSLKVEKKNISVDPLTLFQRMCIAKTSQEDLKEYLEYELAPFPMSLFNEDGMRKGTKSTLYSAFTPVTDCFKLPSKSIVVIDGGHLLHKVVWSQNATFSEIYTDYRKYILKHYGSTVIVVFEGYPDDLQLSTKSAERLRRCKMNISADVIFDQTTVNTTPQEKLYNEQNKKRFVNLLRNELEKSGIITKQADEDADVLIVNTAKSLASQYEAVLIVGEDIDLLVVLTGAPPVVKNVYLKKPGKSNSPDIVYSSSSFLNGSTKYLLLLHAISGCDTTSNIFGYGKGKFCNIFQRNPYLLEVANVFNNPDATATEISKAGEQILVSLYGGDRDQSLTTLRFSKFLSTTTKLNLAKLPPTSDAAQFHSLRTYHQVMAWRGIQKNPFDYGWMKGSRGLLPIMTKKDTAPTDLLKTIKCKCIKSCLGACSCRKSGLYCSYLCKHCCGLSCENRALIVDEDDIDLDTISNNEDESVEVPLYVPPKRVRLIT